MYPKYFLPDFRPSSGEDLLQKWCNFCFCILLLWESVFTVEEIVFVFKWVSGNSVSSYRYLSTLALVWKLILLCVGCMFLIYIWIYIVYIYICIFRLHFFVNANFIKHNRHFMSTYFLLDPFEFPYYFYCIRGELIYVLSIVVRIPSTFCPTLDHHQGRICYKSDVTFVLAYYYCVRASLPLKIMPLAFKCNSIISASS